MIEIKDLVKKYGEKRAVDHISFTVKKGEILGLLGPNGAGKSTTMNILTGYLSATDGEILVDGLDILEHPVEAKKKIGYLPEQPPLYTDMTVSEYLNFVYDLKKVRGTDRKKHLSDIMDTVRISDVKNRLIANLSKGYKQRVGLAQAMVGNPEILILDEPTVGLDPKQIIEIRDVIRKLGKHHTVILSSHILQEVQAVCERVVIINNGKIAAIDSPGNLAKTLSNENKFCLRVAGDERTVLEIIRAIRGVKYVKSLGRKEKGSIDFLIEAEPNVDVRPLIFNSLASAQLPILSMQTIDLSLEDIFLELTEKDSGITQLTEVDESNIEIVAGRTMENKEEETDESNL